MNRKFTFLFLIIYAGLAVFVFSSTGVMPKNLTVTGHTVPKAVVTILVNQDTQQAIADMDTGFFKKEFLNVKAEGFNEISVYSEKGGVRSEKKLFSVSIPTGVNAITVSGIILEISGKAPVVKSCSRSGDLNHDGVVNIGDLKFLLSYWRTSYCEGDFNRDTIIDFRDMSILLSLWGSVIEVVDENN